MEITLSTPEGDVALSGSAKALSSIISSLEPAKPKHQGVVHEPKAHEPGKRGKYKKRRTNVGVPSLLVELVKQGYFETPKTNNEAVATLTDRAGKKVTKDASQQGLTALYKKGLLEREYVAGQRIKYFNGDLSVADSIKSQTRIYIDMVGEVQKLIDSQFFSSPRSTMEVAREVEKSIDQSVPAYRISKPLKIMVRKTLLKASKAPGEYTKYWV